MIAIVNIDPNPRESGPHLYSLRVNTRDVVRFWHAREDDLAACLRRAADAAEQRPVRTTFDDGEVSRGIR